MRRILSECMSARVAKRDIAVQLDTKARFVERRARYATGAALLVDGGAFVNLQQAARPETL
jgi:hypothetical protein